MARKRHDDGVDSGAAPGSTGGQEEPARSELSPAAAPEEREIDVALRPRSFDEYVGQRALTDNLRVFVQAARGRGEPLDHMLFAGPPGLGKTTLAHVIARELGVRIHVTSGPAIDHKGMLAGLLTALAPGDVLFIDEIHRLSPVVEENLYPAMEDYRIDVFIGDGPHARAVPMPLARFTLLGATTRTGLLTSPLLNRFGFVASLGYYQVEDLESIVVRSARLLGVEVAGEGAREIARRARGTPRIANRLLRRVRDFAEVEGDGRVTQAIADFALARLQVDAGGLDAVDRGYLNALIERFGGGPVGIDALAASVGEERSTLEDVVEPFLVQEGFVLRTPRGRVAARKAYLHLGLPEPERGPGQGLLF